MAVSTAVPLLCLCALACLVAFVDPREHARAAEAEPSAEDSERTDAEEEEHDLRERLTEREDRRRPLEPWSTEVARRPLTVGGEYELEPGYLRRRVLGGGVEEPDRLLLEHGLELEAFYSFGLPLSLFAQLRVTMQEDLLSHTFEEVSDVFVERGELWLYSENVAGSRANVDLGRLKFEDERRWWWNDELDAVRFEYEAEPFDVALAVARELAPERSDHDYVEPEHDRVVRLIGEATWNWSQNHVSELFLLHQDDRSPTDRSGEVLSIEREDDSDARLTWIGARLMGAFELRSRGIIGYWLDTALVRGEERLVEFGPLTPGRSVVEGILRRDVSGWAFDAGGSWILPMVWEPRVFAGYAVGSGDSTPEAGDDRSFRQTGIHANEAGFGGVERFVHYGVVLDPELSNLRIVTAGVGLSLLRSSSLDLVYHYFRLVEPATFLRHTNLEATLTGARRDVGHELDLVLAVEEWERLELELIVAAFRAGRAFGAERGKWSYGGFVAIRFAF
jgi:hypothetical protein